MSGMEGIQDLLARRNYPQALDALARFASGAPSLADCEFVRHSLAKVEEIPNGYARLRIAVLRSFLIEPWVPFLITALFRDHRIVADVRLGDFDVFEHHIDEDSDLLTYAPDVVLLAFESRILLKDLFLAAPWSGAESFESFVPMFLDRVERITASIQRRFSCKIIAFNLVGPPFDPFMPASAQDPRCLLNTIRSVNCELAARAKKMNSLSIFDIDYEAARFGLEKAFDQRMWYLAANPFPTAFIGTASGPLAGIVAALRNPGKKVVVLDLDNTLWGGILGEDGERNLKIGTTYPGVAYREFQLFLKALRDKGVLLAVNSKNNEPDCLNFFRDSPDMVLRQSDFACLRINWDDKAQNMRQIAAELNLGLDSFVFIDDSPYECELVRTLLPEVTVYRMPASPPEIPRFISTLAGLSSVKVLEEDMKRNEYYLAERRRQAFRREAENTGDYLLGLKMELTIAPADGASVPRVAQLTQKTNQFNLRTRRYTEPDIERFISEGSRVYTLRMADVFGDYGLVGVAVLVPRAAGEWFFDTLLLSCRVLGRGVENAFVRFCLDEIEKAGGRLAVAEYIQTEKNSQVRDFYSRVNFRPLPDNGPETALFILDLETDSRLEMPAHFTLHVAGDANTV